MELDKIKKSYLKNKDEKEALFYLGQWAFAINEYSKKINTSPINPRLERGLVKTIVEESQMVLSNFKSIQKEVKKLGININYSKRINELEQVLYEANQLLPISAGELTSYD